MGFALKKMLAALLMPLSLVILLLMIGCCCLWLKRYRSARWLVTSGLLLLLVISCTAISDLSLLALEEQYPKWNGKASGLALIFWKQRPDDSNKRDMVDETFEQELGQGVG